MLDKLKGKVDSKVALGIAIGALGLVQTVLNGKKEEADKAAMKNEIIESVMASMSNKKSEE